MASIFLPYIKDTSAGLNVFKGLVRRSKGMEVNTLTDLLTITLKLGVTKVREYIKDIESREGDLEYVAKMELLVATLQEHTLPRNTTAFWEYIYKHLPKNTSLEDSTDEDFTSLFFSVLAVLRPEELQEAGFEVTKDALDTFNEYSMDDLDILISGLSNVEFSDDSDAAVIGFSCLTELTAYLAFKVYCKHHVRINPIKVVGGAYTHNDCISPYMENDNASF